MTISVEQRGVARGMIAAGLIVTVAFGTVALLQPTGLVAGDGVDARLAFAIAWQIPVVAMLVVAVGRLARHRFFTPEDIDGSGMTAGSPQARILQAGLQNTLEQAVVAMGAQLVWAVVAPVGLLAAIPVASGLFLVGRVLFWRGYAHGAAARSAGFALTFYPSVLLLLAAVPMALLRGV